MKTRDFAVVGGIVLLALLVLCFARLDAGGAGQYARVYLDGELYAELPLAEDDVLTVAQENGAINRVEVKDGRVRMQEASCPDGTCVACGWLDPADRQLLPDDRWIVCLPNRVSVELVAG